MVPVVFLFVLFSHPAHGRDFLHTKSDLVPGDAHATQVAGAARHLLNKAFSTMALRQQLEMDGLSAAFLDEFIIDPQSPQQGGVQFWVPRPKIQVASSFLDTGRVGMIDELVHQSVTNSNSAIKDIAQIGAGDDKVASLRLEQQLSAFMERVSREFFTNTLMNTQAVVQQQKLVSEQTQNIQALLQQQKQVSEQIQGVVKELHQQTELMKPQRESYINPKHVSCTISLQQRTGEVGWGQKRKTEETKATCPEKDHPSFQGFAYVPNTGNALTGLMKSGYGSFAYACCAGPAPAPAPAPAS